MSGRRPLATDLASRQFLEDPWGFPGGLFREGEGAGTENRSSFSLKKALGDRMPLRSVDGKKDEAAGVPRPTAS